MSTIRIPALALAVAALLTVSACGGDSDSTNPSKPAQRTAANASDAGSSPTDPCSLTSKETIQQAFGGTVADGKPDHARNCVYAITGGSVRKAVIFHYGTSAEADGIRAGYESNRGPLEDLAGIGEEAYSPGDVGQNEVVAVSGDTVFAVGVNALSPTPVAPGVKRLAKLIADDLG